MSNAPPKENRGSVFRSFDRKNILISPDGVRLLRCRVGRSCAMKPQKAYHTDWIQTCTLFSVSEMNFHNEYQSAVILSCSIMRFLLKLISVKPTWHNVKMQNNCRCLPKTGVGTFAPRGGTMEYAEAKTREGEESLYGSSNA